MVLAHYVFSEAVASAIATASLIVGASYPYRWGSDMPTVLKLREPPLWVDPPVPTKREGIKTHRVTEPGDCWYGVKDDEGVWRTYTDGPVKTTRYRRGGETEWREMVIDYRTKAPIHPDYRKRDVRPMFVILPSGSLFCLHSQAGDGKAWEVTGELPNVTVSPSIDQGKGGWHGHIRNGVMTP